MVTIPCLRLNKKKKSSNHLSLRFLTGYNVTKSQALDARPLKQNGLYAQTVSRASPTLSFHLRCCPLVSCGYFSKGKVLARAVHPEASV